MDGETFARLDSEPKERASHYAPMPTVDPGEGGLRGAFIAGITIIVFTSFAGLSTDAFSTATGITIAIGFLGPFAYLKNQQRLHYAARAKEFASLKKAHYASRT